MKKKDKKKKIQTVKMTNLMFLLLKWRRKLSLKLLNILDSLNKNYSKLQKYQVEKLECLLASKELSVSKIKILKKYKKY